MIESKSNTPKKWWWMVGIAVPITVAFIAALPKFMDYFSHNNEIEANPEGVEIRDVTVSGNKTIGQNSYEGAEINTQVALVLSGGVEGMSAEEATTLQEGMERLKNGDFAGAIPLLQKIASSSPTPAIYNDLAAAYLATSDSAAALEAIAEARNSVSGLDARIANALEWNEKKLLQTQISALNPIGAVNSTDWNGFDAVLTRAEETGGMITLELVLRNSTTESEYICPNIVESYVIDGRTGESWQNSFNSDTDCTRVQSAALLPMWAKFAVDISEHPRLSFVVPNILPFDNVVPVSRNKP